tara:strand:- start:4498 stop:5241 length:744 start_codon:yes stop_codon:yes gene_type:complete
MAVQDILEFLEMVQTKTPRDDMEYMEQVSLDAPQGGEMPMPPPGPPGPPMGPPGPPMGLPPVPPNVHDTLFKIPAPTIATEVVKERYLASRSPNIGERLGIGAEIPSEVPLPVEEPTYRDIIEELPPSRFGPGADIQLLEAARGGLIDLAVGGKFSGRVPGDGHGMEDNVRMPIREGNEQVGTLAVSPKEYIWPADAVSLLGNGNADEGADILDETIKNVRRKATGTDKQPKEIDGLASLQSIMKKV